jgi:hypothetical protein
MNRETVLQRKITFEAVFYEKIIESLKLGVKLSNITHYERYDELSSKNRVVSSIMFKRKTNFIKEILKYLEDNDIYYDIDNTIMCSDGSNYELFIHFHKKSQYFEIEI